MTDSFAEQQTTFFPRADAAILSCRLAPPPTYPDIVKPIFDPQNSDTPCLPWSSHAQKINYPARKEIFAPAAIPEKQLCSDQYLRACLARNERLRLSMLWYYTCDIFTENEFLSGLQEKVCIAHETAGWDCAIIGMLDVNLYKRLATVNAPLGILPRGETLCAHLVSQPPGSVFMLPDMLKDWRFEKSPYVESGGLRAYAGAPLRLQNEIGDTVCFGTICVASHDRQEPLTRAQQITLARLADWIVADIVQLTRARRQRERRRMVDLLAATQKETDDAMSEEPVLHMLRSAYPDAVVSFQTCKSGYVELEGRDPVSLAAFSNILWEDIEHIDDFIMRSNHQEPPTDRVVRAVAAPCESVSGHSFLVIGSKDFRQIFDDIDTWVIETCAGIISHMWHKRLLGEVMVAKEKFLRGFSHSLRTPIHGILGSVELLAEDLKARSLIDTASEAKALFQTTTLAHPDEGHGVYLDTIKRAGSDLISIINSMITLNKWADVAITERHYAVYTTYEIETELVAEVQKAISGDTRYNACIFFNHSSPLRHINLRTDLGLLRDSLLPVIMNAIQNTPGGLVVITMSAHPEQKKLVVDVQDTGHGIPAQDHERIFELYEQVDMHSTGSGLGLTLASKFAALLKGSIDLVSSEINRGSHFRATYQDIEFKPVEPSIYTVPAFGNLRNLPPRFHVPTSEARDVSLSDHFAQILSYHGFIASDKVDDVFFVIDYASDLEKHNATLSQLPTDRIVLCLVPSMERDDYFESAPSNVVYIQGPFGTRRLSSALENADSLIPLLKRNQKQKSSPQIEDGLASLPKVDESTRDNRDKQTSTKQASDSTIQESTPYQRNWVQASASSGHASIALDSSKSSESDGIHTGLSIDPSPPKQAERGLAQLNSAVESLTVTADQGAQPVAEARHRSELVLHSRTITNTSHPAALLVDDNAVNLRVMQMYCKKRNLPYVSAKDGLEAVSKFREHQEHAAQKGDAPIQLVLMDLQMPRCDGIEATRQLRQLENERGWEKSIVLMMTGQDSAADRDAAKNAGSHEYHVKPISMKTLDAGLKRYFPCFQASNIP